jgi:predicted O-methyltransferase YrrM
MKAASGQYSRRELARIIEPIDGWLEPGEAWALYDAALRSVDRFPDLTAVEIGSWKGRSTTAIATALAQKGQGLLHAVDPHEDMRTHRLMDERSTADALLASLTRAGVTPFVRVVQSRSSVVCTTFAPRSVGFLFVDGSHVYEDVTEDIVGWAPRLAEGATVAFHDAASRAGVSRALRAHVLRAGKGFGSPHMVQSTLFVTRTSRTSKRTTLQLGIARRRLWLARLGSRARARLAARARRLARRGAAS